LEQKIKIFTYFDIKEERHTLYGFLQKDILNFFKQLITIPGIGPKIAIVISNSELLVKTQKAIQQNDIDYLVKFPGIGKKTAQQIIFHLQQKLLISKTNNIMLSPKQKEIQTALKNLGFTLQQIQTIWPKLNLTLNLELMLKEALILLAK
ncbi:Holliday junction branch migration protein RuvA, partial [Candidatus Phytoplasma phoenicium]